MALAVAAAFWVVIFASNSVRLVRGNSHVTSQAVIAAIKRGVATLLSRQDAQGRWEGAGYRKGVAQAYGGETALVVEALLNVGQSLHLPQTNMYAPKMKKAINFLCDLQPHGTYAASFQANALALLPPKSRYRRVILKDAWYLLHSIHSNGAYYYSIPMPLPVRPAYLPGKWDNSNTQYGILGMWACAHAGLEIPQGYWRMARLHWVKTQYPNGAWVYNGTAPYPHVVPNPPPGPAGFATMTPAGIASLFICDEYLWQRPRLAGRVDRSILRGLAWMNKNFDPTGPNLYGLYGDERVALASGIQRFSGKNWYNAVAGYLVANGGTTGDWNFDSESIGTAYALLILDRGLNPVVINKLEYSKNYFGPWNARQRDVANFTAWLSRRYETPLNWQVVDIHAPLADWLSAPILFIAGDRDPHFTKGQIQKLRQYVDDGGLVLTSPDGGSLRFRRAMLQYGREVVQGRYQAKICSHESYLYTTLPTARKPGFRPFMAFNNGIRYLWIGSPLDLGAAWQGHRFAWRDYWSIPANIYYYAVGKGALSNRLESLVVAPPAHAPIRSLIMGRLNYPGNWNPEPAAWLRMAQIAATDFQTRLTLKTVTASGNQLAASGCPLLEMTGTQTVTLTPTQIQALRHYLTHGGTLFADAGGGASAFTNSFVNLADALFPKLTLHKIPLDSSIYTGAFPGGVNTQSVNYRKFYNVQHGGQIHHHPRMLGIKQDGRWVVVFSPQDITSGLLGTRTWGISGYTPHSAQALAENVICYCIKHRGRRPSAGTGANQ